MRAKIYCFACGFSIVLVPYAGKAIPLLTFTLWSKIIDYISGLYSVSFVFASLLFLIPNDFK
jgi:hypothetical protein